MKRFVLAMTGASGSVYSLRLLQVLAEAGAEVHLTISPAATQVLRTELDIPVDPSRGPAWDETTLAGSAPLQAMGFPATPSAATSAVFCHAYTDFSAGIASGSFPTDGMVICPCSLGTLGAVASGISTNLIHRAADVHLKESRRLILVPRETPLGLVHLRNMAGLTEAGATILPAMPGFYNNPQSIMDLVDFVVARICDQLDVPHAIGHRWGVSPPRDTTRDPEL